MPVTNSRRPSHHTGQPDLADGSGRADPSSTSIEFSEYVRVLRQRRVWIAAIMLGVLALTAAYTFTRPPRYVSSATVQVRPVNVDPSRLNVRPDQLVVLTTEREVVRSYAVAGLAAGDVPWDATPEELVAATSVSVPGTTQVLVITFTAESALRAQRGAQAMAEAYLEHRAVSAEQEMDANRSRVLELISAAEEQLADVTNQAAGSDPASAEATFAGTRRDILLDRLSRLHSALADIESMSTIPGELIGPAPRPNGPAGPDHPRTLVLGAFAGLVLAVGTAFLRDRLDDRLREDTEVRYHTGAPVLAQVPRSPRRWYAHVRRDAGTAAAVSESYRKLRANTLMAMDLMRARTLLVTSPVRGDRKTTTAVQLAIAAARTGRQVALVSADLRLPTIHEVLDLDLTPGLSEVLWGAASLSDVIRRKETIPNLEVITSGEPNPFLGDLLQSSRVEEVFRELSRIYDLVVFDAPPVLPVADVLALCRPVDAVLLSVRAGHTRLSRLDETVQQLRSAGAVILGTVIHDSSSSLDDGDALPYLLASDDDGELPTAPSVTRR